jgi:hypothetical protein
MDDAMADTVRPPPPSASSTAPPATPQTGAVPGAGGALGPPQAGGLAPGAVPEPGKPPPSPERLKELQEDQAKARKELAGHFDVVDESVPKKDRLPNQVTKAEMEQYVQLYSNIRMGETNLKIDTSAIKDKDQQAAFQQNVMGDIGTMLETEAGRALVGDLAKGKGKDGKEHTTTISGSETPLDARAGATDPDKAGLRETTGTDMSVKYAPGQQVNLPPGSKNEWGPTVRSDVSLFHELTHALHGVNGTTQPGGLTEKEALDALQRGDMPTNPNLREEYATIGIGPFAGAPGTENAYRDERRTLAKNGSGLPGDGAPTMGNRDNYDIKK